MLKESRSSIKAGIVTSEMLKSMYVSMLRIRQFEDKVAELVEAKELRTPTHLYVGQEAVAVGVCASLRRDDYILGNHRSHGHYLAKGGNLQALMAEMFCKSTGCAKGRGGSMHLYAGEVGLLGTVPMVAATIPVAVGAALAATLRGVESVAVAFFGDGATEEGVFHESANFAALKKLPVLFICENNFYSSHLPLHARRPADNLNELVAPYGMPGLRIDGNDVAAVYLTAKEAVERARSGQGPSFIECRTYRWRGHVGPSYDLDVGIRDKAELNAWMARCPIKMLEDELEDDGTLSRGDIADIKAQIAQEIAAAVRFAKGSPYPAREGVHTNVFFGQLGG